MFERKNAHGKKQQLGSILHKRTDDRPGDERQDAVNAELEANQGDDGAVTAPPAGGSSRSSSSGSSSSSSSSSGSAAGKGSS